MLVKYIADYDSIYIACGATDMRMSMDGLAHLVKKDFQMNPFENYLFLFVNRRRDRMKGLSWDKNGFCIYYKRLDGRGARYSWPETPGEIRGITVDQLQNLLSGLTIYAPKGFHERTSGDF